MVRMAIHEPIPKGMERRVSPSHTDNKTQGTKPSRDSFGHGLGNGGLVRATEGGGYNGEVPKENDGQYDNYITVDHDAHVLGFTAGCCTIATNSAVSKSRVAFML